LVVSAVWKEFCGFLGCTSIEKLRYLNHKLEIEAEMKFQNRERYETQGRRQEGRCHHEIKCRHLWVSSHLWL